MLIKGMYFGECTLDERKIHALFFERAKIEVKIFDRLEFSIKLTAEPILWRVSSSRFTKAGSIMKNADDILPYAASSSYERKLVWAQIVGRFGERVLFSFTYCILHVSDEKGKAMQPLDVCINKPFKDYVREEWKEWMANGQKTYTASGRMRVPSLSLLCQFVIKAWSKVKTETVIKSFQKCSISALLEDTEDDQMANSDQDHYILPLNRGGWNETEKFLKAVIEILLKHIKDSNDPNSKVIQFYQPLELASLLDLNIPNSPMPLAQLLKDCSETLKYQVKTGHPRFFNQLSTGLDVISMAGEWLTATANTNMFTYEISPVFVLMEKEIINLMCQIIGWPEGERDGILCPGGALSNAFAVNVARHYFYPRCKSLGMTDMPRLAMFTSADSHYSIRGAAALLGIGVDNCIVVQVDDRGKMIPEALEEAIIASKEEGCIPFFVNAVAGSTVYGAFDPINLIADICEKYGLWLHVDAAWGGAMLFCKKYHHLDGIHRANSVTWNPHKLMGILLQCSVCLVRKEGLLFQCNQMCADYLFQQDKPYDVSYDTGDKTVQCGRHNDIFKLWLAWRAKGMLGYEKQVERLMGLAAYVTAKIKRTPGYEMVLSEPEFLNVCFWYVPKKLRHLEAEERTARLEKVAPKIKGKMMEAGTTMVAYQPDKDKPNFFRLIISNPATTTEDLDFFVDEIARLGESI